MNTATLNTSPRHAGDVQAAIDAGTNLAEPEPLDTEGRFFSVLTPAGAEHHVVDLEDHLDRHRDRPRRKTGTATAHTTGAFVDYLAKHSLVETEIWADLTSSQVAAVINAHTGTERFVEQHEKDSDAEDGHRDGPAGWGDHRLVLSLHHTPSWKAWTGRNGNLTGQVEFAEFIEDHTIDIASPPAADMLELAQTFTANRQINFDSSHRLSSGQVHLNYHEEIDAKAGRHGDITVPERFELQLQPYEGGPFYKVTARLRYRIIDGSLRIGYSLERPEDVLRNAFADVTDLIEERSGRRVWHGTSLRTA